jgi:hypothetical protein
VAPPTKIALRTFIATTIDVFTRAGRLVRTQEVIDPIDHPLKLEILALLFLKPGLDANVSQAISNAFQNSPLTNASISDAETKLVQSGAKLDDYQVDLCFKLVRDGARDISHTNAKAFVDQVAACKQFWEGHFKLS